jgi:hypothetical protein
MLILSCRAPVAGVMLSSRCNWSAVRMTLSAAVFSSTRATRRLPGMGGDVLALGRQPGQRDLCRGGTGLGSDVAYVLHDLQVLVEGLAEEARIDLAPVVRVRIWPVRNPCPSGA